MKSVYVFMPLAAGVLALSACGSDNSTKATSSAPTVASSSTSTSTSSTPTAVSAPNAPAAPSTSTATATVTTTVAAPVPSASASTTSAASGPVHYQAHDSALFMSPSGKNECSFDGHGSVTCYLSPAAQQKTNGKSLVTLGPSGISYILGDMPISFILGQGGEWATNGSGPMPPHTETVYILPYGRSITQRGTTCSSSTNGFTCSNSAGGFTVNSHGVTIH